MNNKSTLKQIVWKRETFLILMLAISISCIRKSDDKATIKDALVSDWPLSIQEHKVGMVSTGIKIDESINIISKYFKVEPDSILSSDDENYSFFYTVKNKNGQPVFNIHPATDKGNGREFVYSYEVLSEEYSIDKTNVSVGKEVNDLKKSFTLTETYFDYDDGLFVFVSDFSGSFSIELDSEHKNSLGESNYENPEDIPGHFKLKSITVY